MSTDAKRRNSVSWGMRLLSALGFVLAATGATLIFSRQVAIDRARNYLRQRYHINVEVPVKDVRPELLQGPLRSGRSLPPFGFCWTVEIDATVIHAEVTLNPWTHEIVDWRID